MKYWEEITDSHIQLGTTDVYQTYPMVAGQINKNGYIDDLIDISDVIYIGSCDIMSSLSNREDRWISLLHKDRYKSMPCMSLASSGTGLPTAIRRLHSYIKKYGPPKNIYMTIARFDSVEHVNKSGKCYNVNSRAGTPRYLKKRNLLTDEEFQTWETQILAYKQLYNIYNNQYLLEERFAFLETLCIAHDIKLQWTFNPTDAASVILHRNIEIFHDISEFMKNAFVGMPELADHLFDRSIGVETQRNIYCKFINPEKWDYNKLKTMASKNYNWLEKQYGTDLIKNEE